MKKVIEYIITIATIIIITLLLIWYGIALNDYLTELNKNYELKNKILEHKIMKLKNKE